MLAAGFRLFAVVCALVPVAGSAALMTARIGKDETVSTDHRYATLIVSSILAFIAIWSLPCLCVLPWELVLLHTRSTRLSSFALRASFISPLPRLQRILRPKGHVYERHACGVPHDTSAKSCIPHAARSRRLCLILCCANLMCTWKHAHARAHTNTHTYTPHVHSFTLYSLHTFFWRRTAMSEAGIGQHANVDEPLGPLVGAHVRIAPRPAWHERKQGRKGSKALLLPWPKAACHESTLRTSISPACNHTQHGAPVWKRDDA